MRKLVKELEEGEVDGRRVARAVRAFYSKSHSYVEVKGVGVNYRCVECKEGRLVAKCVLFLESAIGRGSGAPPPVYTYYSSSLIRKKQQNVVPKIDFVYSCQGSTRRSNGSTRLFCCRRGRGMSQYIWDVFPKSAQCAPNLARGGTVLWR
jgi:hypothetical protein